MNHKKLLLTMACIWVLNRQQEKLGQGQIEACHIRTSLLRGLTFAPNSSATFIIECVDAGDANNVLYTQILKEVIIGERTIKAPTVNNYNLITDSPKNIKVLYPETTVTFEYEYVPYETPVPTFEPVPTIEPKVQLRMR